MAPEGPDSVFGGEVSLKVRDGVAVLTMIATDGEFPWGTKREEHRFSPALVQALGEALDAVEARDEVCAVVLANEGKYWSNGMDLKFLDVSEGPALKEHSSRVTALLARLCCFPLPTVAAVAGHWCATGGMMGLSLDYRIMSSDRGFFFIPGVDLGLVYSPAQVELMKAKLPLLMHREVILFNSKRWSAADLVDQGVVEAAVPSDRVAAHAFELAAALRPKGRGPARAALGGIKRTVYRSVLQALEDGQDMGYGGRRRGVDRAAPPASKL